MKLSNVFLAMLVVSLVGNIALLTLLDHERRRVDLLLGWGGEDLEVKLPESSGATLLTRPVTKLLIVYVTADGEYVAEGKGHSLEQLKALMTEAVAADPDQKVLLRGHAKAWHGDVAAAVTVCSEAGIREANIGYDKRSFSPPAPATAPAPPE